LKNRFYSKSKKEQNISWFTGIYLIGILFFSIILSILAPFFDMPSLKESGKMVYFSSLFIAEKPKNKIIKIHGGTLFDYYFVIDKSMNGKQRTDFIIQQYLEGLLALIECYKDDKDIKIQGTSYILNKRTAEKLGFKIIDTNFIQKMVLLFNYFTILISNSIAKNKLSLPKLNETKTFEASIKDLIEHTNYIQNLNKRLTNFNAEIA